MVKAEIRSSTQSFLRERGLAGSFLLRLEVDLLFIGFASDGGFGYDLGSTLVHELLSSMHSMDRLCPNVWETDSPASVCYQPTFVVLTPPSQSILQVESLIKEHMRSDGKKSEHKHGSEQDMYRVEASADFEDQMRFLLDESYMIDGISPPGSNNLADHADHRLAIIIVNPDKRRLVAYGSNEEVPNEARVLNSWREGLDGAGEAELLAHEAGMLYRYNYKGSGASASWVSRHNFVFVDISAGPVSYGPLAASDAWVHSPQIPRLHPMFSSMEQELRDVGFGTMRSRMIEQAEEASQRVFAGSLAEVISSATQYLFVPDMKFKRLEHARQVIIPIIVLHDLDDEELEKASVDQQIDLVGLQMLADSLVDSSQVALIEVSDMKRLHSHPQVIAALHKSQVSRSELVMMNTEGWEGLHRSHHTHVDSEILLRSLLSSLSDLSDESFAHTDPDSDIEKERELSQHARHYGSRVFPVFLLQLSSASIGNSPHLTTEERQLFASNHDGAFVIQMVGSRGREGQPTSFFSGHEVEGRSLFVNSSHVTSNIAASMLVGLTGIVPPQERRVHGIKSQDWRWALGASPFGPYSHSHEVSGIFGAAARRNFFISHIESSLSAVTSRLKRLDTLYISSYARGRLGDPFAFLFDQQLPHESNLNQSNSRSFQAALVDEMLSDHLMGSNESESLLGDSSTVTLINTMLQDIEAKLEELSWALYTLSFDSAREILVRLLALVDQFSKQIDKRLDTAEDFAACCHLKFQSHHPGEGQKAAYIILGLSFLLAVSLLSITCCARKRPQAQGMSNPSFSQSRSQMMQRSPSSVYSPSSIPERSGSVLNWLGGEKHPNELPTFTKSSNAMGDGPLQRMFSSNH